MTKRHIGAFIGIALIAGLVGSGLTAWVMQPGVVTAQPTTVTAQTFRVVDPAGRTRALLTAPSNDLVGLVLWDSRGNQRAHLTQSEADGDAVYLNISDAGGQSRLAVTLVQDQPGIFIDDASGNLIWGAP